jgi:hypothetical protein
MQVMHEKYRAKSVLVNNMVQSGLLSTVHPGAANRRVSRYGQMQEDPPFRRVFGNLSGQ